MKRQLTNTKVTLTKEQTPNFKCITGTAGMGQGIPWSVTVNWRVPMFWKGVAFNTGHPKQTQQWQLRTGNEHPSLLTHPSQCNLATMATWLGMATSHRGGLLRKRLRWIRLAYNLASYMAHRSVIPTKAQCHISSILPFGSFTITTFLFYEAAFPTIEMSSRVIRNRMEGEAGDGHGHSLLSSKKEALSNCVSNIVTSHKENWRGLGLTQLKFNNVSRICQLLLPQGRAMCENVLMLTSMQWCASVVHVTSSSVSCCQKEVAWKMPQLSLIRLFGAHKREKSRRGGKISIKLG